MNTLDQILSEGIALHEIPTDRLIEITADKDVPNAFLPLIREEYIRRLKSGDGKLRVESELATLKKVVNIVEKHWKKMVDTGGKDHRYYGVSLSDESFIISTIDQRSNIPVYHHFSLSDLEKHL